MASLCKKLPFNSSILFLLFLTLINFAADKQIKATSTLSPHNVDKIGKQTLEFIDKLHDALPEIIKDLNNSSTSDLKMFKIVSDSYKKEVTLIELLKALIPFRKNNLNKRLISLFGYFITEILIIKAISNLENQKIYMPLNQKIDRYIKEIKKKHHTLNETIKRNLIEYGFPTSDLKSTKTSNKSVLSKTILENCNYKKLPELFDIKTEELKKELCNFVEKIFSCLLTEGDKTILHNFVNGATFQKIKNASTTDALKSISKTLLSELPDSARKLILQAKTTIFITD